MYNSASLLVTEHCNLACTYCFERFKKDGLSVMSKEVADKALDFVFDNAAETQERHSEIMLFGGEPTLNPELCSYIIKSAYARGQRRNIHTTISLVTNCTVWSQELADVIAEYLDKMQFMIQLSIDGPADMQNQFRVKKDGTGSFDLVLPTMEKWKELMKNHFGYLTTHPCVTKHTVGRMLDVVKFFQEEAGIPRVWLLPVCEEEWDSLDVSVYREQTKLIVDRILEQAEKEQSLSPIEAIDPFGKALSDPRRQGGKACGAGSHFCTITADGSIYPCHQLYYAEDGHTMKIGHVDTGVDEHKGKLFQDLETSDLDCADDCDHGDCYRCPAMSWQMYKTFTTQRQGAYCEMMKIDQQNQNRIRKEIERMGLNKQNQCDQHSPDASRGCDVVVSGDASEKQSAAPASKEQRLIELHEKKIAFDAAYQQQLLRIIKEG